MLDIQLLREDKGGNPEIVRESQRRRYAPVELVDAIIELDKKWREGKRDHVAPLAICPCVKLKLPFLKAMSTAIWI